MQQLNKSLLDFSIDDGIDCLWLSSSVSELLAFAYSDAFSVSPVMIQRFPRVPEVSYPATIAFVCLRCQRVLLFLGVCVEILPVPGSLHRHGDIQQVAGVMLKVRGVRVSRSLSPISTKSRYLYDDQVLPMLQPQSRIMRLVRFLENHLQTIMVTQCWPVFCIFLQPYYFIVHFSVAANPIYIET